MQGPGTGACDSGTLRQDDEQGITRLLPTAAHAAALTSALPRPTLVETPTDGGGEVCAAPPPPGEEPVPQPCPATFALYDSGSKSCAAQSFSSGSQLWSLAAQVT